MISHAGLPRCVRFKRNSAKRIEAAVAALAALPDDKSGQALELLSTGDTRGAKQVFGQILEEKSREGGDSLKQAAAAARNLAALTEESARGSQSLQARHRT